MDFRENVGEMLQVIFYTIDIHWDLQSLVTTFFFRFLKRQLRILLFQNIKSFMN